MNPLRALSLTALIVAGVAAHAFVVALERAVDWRNDVPKKG